MLVHSRPANRTAVGHKSEHSLLYSQKYMVVLYTSVDRLKTNVRRDNAFNKASFVTLTHKTRSVFVCLAVAQNAVTLCLNSKIMIMFVKSVVQTIKTYMVYMGIVVESDFVCVCVCVNVYFCVYVYVFDLWVMAKSYTQSQSYVPVNLYIICIK